MMLFVRERFSFLANWSRLPLTSFPPIVLDARRMIDVGNDSMFCGVLGRAMETAGANGVLVYAGTRFTPFEFLDYGHLLPIAHIGVPAGELVVGLPCRCIRKFLLDDSFRQGDCE